MWARGALVPLILLGGYFPGLRQFSYTHAFINTLFNTRVCFSEALLSGTLPCKLLACLFFLRLCTVSSTLLVEFHLFPSVNYHHLETLSRQWSKTAVRFTLLVFHILSHFPSLLPPCPVIKTLVCFVCFFLSLFQAVGKFSPFYYWVIFYFDNSSPKLYKFTLPPVLWTITTTGYCFLFDFLLIWQAKKKKKSISL